MRTSTARKQLACVRNSRDWMYSQRQAHRHSSEDSTRIASEVPRIAASDPQYPRVIRRLPTPSEKLCRRFLVHSQLALRARLANSRASHLLTKDGRSGILWCRAGEQGL